MFGLGKYDAPQPINLRSLVFVWHYYHPMLREGRDAIARIGEFINARMNRKH